jgi:hypothetical protein
MWILDAQGVLRLESRASLLLRAPLRIIGEAVSGAATLARARRELRHLEGELVKREAPSAVAASISSEHEGGFGLSSHSLHPRYTGPRNPGRRSIESTSRV